MTALTPVMAPPSRPLSDPGHVRVTSGVTSGVRDARWSLRLGHYPVSGGRRGVQTISVAGLASRARATLGDDNVSSRRRPALREAERIIDVTEGRAMVQ